jgi:glycosyltransferase involved in cell wall biosynthesis
VISGTPTVSVVIPFHSRSSSRCLDWLLEAVESVRAQTMQELELVLVDDGSQETVPVWLKGDRQIRYLRLSGKGESRARNAGVRISRGFFVAFLDSDDTFEIDKLERQLVALERQPTAVLCHTSYNRIDESGAFLEYRPAGRFNGRVFPRITTNCPVAMSTVLVRRSALGADPFAPVKVGEDLLLWVRLARDAPFVGIDRPLASIRILSETRSLKPEAVVTARRQLLPYLTPRLQRRVEASIQLSLAFELWRRGGPKSAVVGRLAKAAILRPNPFAILAAAGRGIAERPRTTVPRPSR